MRTTVKKFFSVLFSVLMLLQMPLTNVGLAENENPGAKVVTAVQRIEVRWRAENMPSTLSATVTVRDSEGETATEDITLIPEGDNNLVGSVTLAEGSTYVSCTVNDEYPAGLAISEWLKDPQTGAEYLVVTDPNDTRQYTVNKNWIGVDANERQDIYVWLSLISNPTDSGGTVVIREQIIEDNESSTTFVNLPKYNTDGSPFYGLQVHERWTSDVVISLDGAMGIGIDASWDSDTTLTNTVKKAYSVSKAWANGADGGNTSVELELTRRVKGNVDDPWVPLGDDYKVTLEKKGTSWETKTFPEVELGVKNADGSYTAYEYSVREIGVWKDAEWTFDAYDWVCEKGGSTDFTVTNTRKPTADQKYVRVLKTWEDAETGRPTTDYTRGNYFIVTDEKGNVVNNILLNGPTDSSKVENLYIIANKLDDQGIPHTYTVTEVTNGKFVTTGGRVSTSDEEDVWAFTNTSVTRDVELVKVWAGGGEVPVSSVNFHILQNGEEFWSGDEGSEPYAVEVSGDNWRETIKGLPRYDADGGEYAYSAIEINAPEGYYPNVQVSEDGTITVTNTPLIKGETMALVIKQWIKDQPIVGELPELTLTLYVSEDNNRDNATSRWSEKIKDGTTLWNVLGPVLIPSVYNYYWLEETWMGTDANGEPEQKTKLLGSGTVPSSGYLQINGVNRVSEFQGVKEQKATYYLSKNWNIGTENVPEDMSWQEYVSSLVSRFNVIATDAEGNETTPDELTVLSPTDGSVTYDAGVLTVRGQLTVSLELVSRDTDGITYTYDFDEIVDENSPFVFEKNTTTGTLRSYRFTNTPATEKLFAVKYWDLGNRGGNIQGAQVTLRLTRSIDGAADNSFTPRDVTIGVFGPSNTYDFESATVSFGEFPTHMFDGRDWVPYTYTVSEFRKDGLVDIAFFQSSNLGWVESSGGRTAQILNKFDNSGEEAVYTVIKDWTGVVQGNQKPVTIVITGYDDDTGAIARDANNDEIVRELEFEVPEGDTQFRWTQTVQLPYYYMKDGVPVAIRYEATETTVGLEAFPADSDTLIIDGVVYRRRSNGSEPVNSVFRIENNVEVRKEDFYYDILVEKTWKNVPDLSTVPDVTFLLYQDGKFYRSGVVDGVVSPLIEGASEPTAWWCNFEDVPYYNIKDGEPHRYIVYEAPLDDYTTRKLRDMVIKTYENSSKLYGEIAFENAPKNGDIEEYPIELIKAWNDGGRTALRVSTVGADERAQVEFVIHGSDGSTRTVKIDGTTPANNTWSALEGLDDQYIAGYNADDEPILDFIKYWVTEDDSKLPYHKKVEEIDYDGVETFIDDDGIEKFTLQNVDLSTAKIKITITNELMNTTELTGTKRWVTINSPTGEGEVDDPETLAVRLTRSTVANGPDTTWSQDCTIVPGRTTNDTTGETWILGAYRSGNTWTWKAEELDRFDSGGNPFTYHWTETPVPHYAHTVEPNGTLVNTMDTVNIRVTKEWDHMGFGSDLPGVSFTLYRKGTEADAVREAVGEPTGLVTEYSWHGLYKYDSIGGTYTYEVEESETESYSLDNDTFEVVAPPTYGYDYEWKAVNSLDLTNLLIEKHWYNDLATNQPSEIKVVVTGRTEIDGYNASLLQNGMTYRQEVTLSAPDWKAEVTDLPAYVYINGARELVTYVVTENPVPAGYTYVTYETDTTYTLIGDDAAPAATATIDADADATRTAHLGNARLIELAGRKQFVGDAKVWQETRLNSEIEITLEQYIGDTKTDATWPAQKVRPVGENAGTPNAWRFTWDGMVPAYDDEGNLYTYKFVETALNGYTTTVDDVVGNTIEAVNVATEATPNLLTNTLVTVDTDGVKSWLEATSFKTPTGATIWPETFTEVRPGQIKLRLMRDGAVYHAGVTGEDVDGWVTLGVSTENKISWPTEWTKLPKTGTNADGSAYSYTYTVQEWAINGFKTPVIDVDNETDENIFDIDVRNSLDLFNLTVTKNWVDDGIADRADVGDMTITLIGTVGNDQKVVEVERSIPASVAQAGGFWTTIEGLPRYYYGNYTASGEEITYRLKEDWVTGYVLEGGATDDNSVAVTVPAANDANGAVTLKNEKKSWDITVTKVWAEDADYATLTRPDVITIVLMQKAAGEADAVEYGRKTITAPALSTSFDNLPQVGPGNVGYTYTVYEVGSNGSLTELHGYTIGTPAPTEDGGWQITNTLNTVPLKGIKTWDDAENINNLRPTSITVELWRYEDGGTQGTQVGASQPLTLRTAENPGGDAVADGASAWIFTWPVNVPLTGKNGEEYTYEFVEVSTGTTYTATTATADAKEDGEELDELVNMIPLINLSGEKKWTEPTWTESGISGQTTVGNWEAFRPSQVIVTLYRKVGETGTGVAVQQKNANLTQTLSGTTWSWAFEKLPEFETYYGEDGENVPYIYYVKENVVPGYTPTPSTVTGESEEMHLTNALNTIDIDVTKTWNDEGHRDSRPSEIDIALIAKTTSDGEIFRISAKLMADGYTTTFAKMPTHYKGAEITYSVVETVPNGYIDDGNTYPLYGEETVDGVYTLTIENAIKLNTISMVKNWEDGARALDARPTEVTFQLWRTTDASRVGDPTVDTATDTTMVVELPVEINGNQQTIDFGEQLIENTAGQAYTYWVEESVPTGYVIKAEGHNPEVGITNQLETVDVTVKKVWTPTEGSSLTDLPTAMYFTVHGKANGVSTTGNGINVTLPDNGNWETTREGLPKYAYINEVAVEIDYTMVETEHNAYTREDYDFAKDSGGNFILTATNTLKLIDVVVTKAFTGEDGIVENVANLRPESIKVTLKRTGDSSFELEETIDGTNVLNEDYKVTFPNLPEFDANGTAYNYYVVEDEAAVIGYTLVSNTTATRVAGEDFAVTLTNNLNTITVGGTKKWTDTKVGDDYPSRPGEIIIELTRFVGDEKDASFSDTRTIGYEAVTSQEWTFGNLPKVDPASGEDYIYFVRELVDDGSGALTETIPGYEAEYLPSSQSVTGTSGTIDIRNTQDTMKYTVTKNWIDADNASGARPGTLDITLTGRDPQSGDIYYGPETMEMDLVVNINTWQVEFTGLPRYTDGNALIQYTFTESDVGSYTSTNQTEPETKAEGDLHGSITNWLRTTPLSGFKTWNDDNNLYSTRPESIHIALYRSYVDGDGATQTETVVEDHEVFAPWTWSFENMEENSPASTPYTYWVEELSELTQYTVRDNTLAPMNLTNDLKRVTVAVTKNWDDHENALSKRPQAIDVRLQAEMYYEQNGAGAVRTINFNPGQLTVVNNWYVETGVLPKYDARGELIQYKVVEAFDSVTGERYEVSAVTNETFTDGRSVYAVSLTNKLKVRDITIAKVWENDLPANRPATIWVDLLADGTVVNSVQLTAVNNWHQVKLSNLPINNASGQPITYEVVERAVTGYTTTYAWDEENGLLAFTVTNRYMPDTTPGGGGTPPPSSGGTTPPPSTSTTPPPGTGTGTTPTPTLPAVVTPSPSPTPATGSRYITIVDLDTPLGYGENLNQGDCFD